MKYLSTTQAAERWGLSARRVAILCEQERIADARIKSGKYIKSKEEDAQ